MKAKVQFFLLSLSFILLARGAFAQVAGINPDIAFDTANNRYLVVFEQDTLPGNSEIFAQFRNHDGSLVAGDPVRISDPRPTQGCFYVQFDEQNGDITTPIACPQNKNPSVAYNNGQFLIAWEVHGVAAMPITSPDNQFVNIFAQIVDAATLNPLPGWEEGILISKIFIAANNAESRCGDKHACNDSQIQAWSQSLNPDVAPRLGAGGFVVTWQTNRDFIGCADPSRRQAWSVYGRYIDQAFSATSTTNPPMFAVYKDDSTMADNCEPQSNVDNGVNPRIAFNQSTNDFVITYEVARASGGNASIGAKRVTINTLNVGEVTGSIMPDIVASVDGGNLTNGDIVAYENNYYIFISDGTNIRAKSFTSGSISNSTPDVIELGGGAKTKPRAASTLGPGGTRPGSNPDPERLIVAYEQGGNIRAAVLNESLVVTRAPTNISIGGPTDNQLVEVASDLHDFVATWQGNQSGEKVFAGFIDSADGSGNNPPTAPGLLTPNNGVTFAPTRAYLSWNAATDPDGDTVTYNIYFGENVVPATPQETGVTGTDYVIGPETFADTGITLQPNKVYQWKIEADDGNGGRTSSTVRTLNTDNSVVGWWRFDDNPALIDCGLGEAGSKTVCDYSGLNNHGTPSGSPVWLPPTADILGRALDFDGVNDRILVDHNAILDVPPIGFSISCKIRPNVAPVITSIINKDNPSQGYGIFQTASNNISFTLFTTGGFRTVLGDATALIGTYFRVTGVYNGASSSIYYDNALQQSMAVPAVVNNTSVIKIATSVTDNSFFDGEIDECIIFNKGLNTTELDNLVAGDN